MKKFLMLLITAVVISACDSTEKTITYHDAKYGYAETVVIKEGHKTTIHISGQIGEGNNLEEQMQNALANLKKQLNKHDADYSNLVKINTYTVDYRAKDLETFRTVRAEIFGKDIVPASTLVGVQSLARDDWKIEIDAVAIKLN